MSGNPDDELSNYTGVTDAGLGEPCRNFQARLLCVTVTIEHEPLHSSLKSITTFRPLELESHNTDSDGTPYDLFASPQRNQAERQFSQ